MNDALSLALEQVSPAPQAPPTPTHVPAMRHFALAAPAQPAAVPNVESPTAAARRLPSETGEDADLSSATWSELMMYLRGRLTY